MTETEGGAAPVSPPQTEPPGAEKKPRRKAPQRGKAGGRTKPRSLWFTETESAQLEARAAKAGLSVSSYMRAAALGDAGPRARRAPTIEKKILGAAIAELNKVGSNLNQIARAVNRGREHDEDQLQIVTAELRNVLTTIRDAFYT